MFNDPEHFRYKYAPILSVSPAEMMALEELPEKARDQILSIFPLRGWVGSQKLENSISRIEKSIGDRYWIADIDSSFLDITKKNANGKYPRPVFDEIEDLLIPADGYENWYRFLCNHDKAIPTVQLGDIDQLVTQVTKLETLGRGIVVRFTIHHMDTSQFVDILTRISSLKIENILILFDYGQVRSDVLTFAARIESTIRRAYEIFPKSTFSISCSSFPSSFSGYNSSEHSIYERMLFNIVSKACNDISMIYSDRGGARAEKIRGGGGIPSPRIDYPLPNDWKFIREEFENPASPKEGEKEFLYTKIAKKIMGTEYWKPSLHVWGTQIIDFTSTGDKHGINSPTKSTAVRINIHLHQQLYYDDPDGMVDTDEDWED